MAGHCVSKSIITADRTSQPAAQLQEQDGQLQSELDSQLKALQQEVDAQYALNRILKAQIKQVDDKLALNEKATRDIANELADKTQMLSTARRKNFELQGGGQLSTQASLPAAPSRQDSYRAHITPDSLAAGGSSLDPLTKRTAELEKERESNILLQRYSAHLLWMLTSMLDSLVHAFESAVAITCQQLPCEGACS